MNDNTDDAKPDHADSKKRYVMIFLVIAALVLGFLYAAGVFGGHGTTAQKFVDLQENNKPYYGFRACACQGGLLAR